MSYAHKLASGSKTPADGLTGSEGPNQYRTGKEPPSSRGKSISDDATCKINHGRALKNGGSVKGDPSSHHDVKGRKHKGRSSY